MTPRKQNIREGLINNTDEAYLLFDKLNHKIRKLEIFSCSHEHGEKIIEYVKMHLFQCHDLLQGWLFSFNINESQEDDLMGINCSLFKIYDKVLSKHIKVTASHFRKDYLLCIKRQKKR